MRRLVAAALVSVLAVVLVFSVAGCGGGGGSSSSSTSTDQNAAAPAAAPAPTGPTAPLPDRSAPESATWAPLPTGSTVPSSVLEAVAAKQPLLIFFYSSNQPTASQQRGQIDKAVKPYRGLIDVQSFDLGKYVSQDGVVVKVDPAIGNNTNASRAATFANELGVNFTPYIVIADSNGYTTWKGRGPYDHQLLDQQIQRVTQ